MKAAIYARVSTVVDQEPENQLAELRRYAEARGWPATAYADKGVSDPRTSGLRSTRPARI
jgi:DNA invertase Pin-like site-specific DNA recombinase